MGMYTEMVMAVELKNDTPQQVRDVLGSMTGVEEVEYSTPNHPLFQAARWKWMLNGDSAYFEGDSRSTLTEKYLGYHTLTIRCNIKNYDGELEKFLEWITPYVSSKGFAGYTRYEETEDPTLIYFDETGLVRR